MEGLGASKVLLMPVLASPCPTAVSAASKKQFWQQLASEITLETPVILVDRPTQLICTSDIYLLSWRW